MSKLKTLDSAASEELRDKLNNGEEVGTMEPPEENVTSEVNPITLQVRRDGEDVGNILDLGLGEVLMRISPPSRVYDLLGKDPVKVSYLGPVTCSSCGTEDSPRYRTAEGPLWAVTVCREEGFVWQKYMMEMH